MEIEELSFNLHFKYIDYCRVGTAADGGSIRLTADMTTVAKNIDVGEHTVHGHRTDFSSLSIIVPAVTRFVSSVTAMRSFSFYKSDLYFWFHNFSFQGETVSSVFLNTAFLMLYSLHPYTVQRQPWLKEAVALVSSEAMR